MIYNNQVVGTPLMVYTDVRAQIEAIVPEHAGALAFTLDTLEFAFYNGTTWVFHGEVSGTGTWSDNELPTGDIDGLNTTFVLAQTPVLGWIQLFLNGVMLEPGAGNDYTVSGDTITMLFAPQTGDKLRAYYMY